MFLKLYRHLRYLRDVLLFSVTAFGGPNAHLALMLEFLVNKRKYISEKELIELVALCQLLPGPTSTQTITAIGYKRGGPVLALATLLVWALPAVIAMTLLAFLYRHFATRENLHYFRFLMPAAVGFIAFAGLRIALKVIHNKVTFVILVGSAVVSMFLNSPWIFPLLIVAGGVATNFTSNAEPVQPRPGIRPNWTYLCVYGGIFIAAATAALITDFRPIVLFENFYRFGSLVFGGGQVLIPMMLEQFTQHRQYLTEEQFLTGYGMVQGLPGPVFSFAAFTGNMAFEDWGTKWQIFGSVIGAVGIFLPGALLIFFVYPLWEYLKKFKVITKSLQGVNAAAAGLVLAAAVIMFLALDISWGAISAYSFLQIGVVAITFLLLQFTRTPAPVIVILAVMVGIIV